MIKKAEQYERIIHFLISDEDKCYESKFFPEKLKCKTLRLIKEHEVSLTISFYHCGFMVRKKT